MKVNIKIELKVKLRGEYIEKVAMGNDEMSYVTQIIEKAYNLYGVSVIKSDSCYAELNGVEIFLPKFTDFYCDDEKDKIIGYSLESFTANVKELKEEAEKVISQLYDEKEITLII